VRGAPFRARARFKPRSRRCGWRHRRRRPDARSSQSLAWKRSRERPAYAEHGITNRRLHDCPGEARAMRVGVVVQSSAWAEPRCGSDEACPVVSGGALWARSGGRSVFPSRPDGGGAKRRARRLAQAVQAKGIDIARGAARDSSAS
jgi:hypothetical protein